MAMYRINTVISGLPGGPFLSTQFFDADTPLTTAQGAADAVTDFWATSVGVLKSPGSAQVEPDVSVIDETDGSLIGIEPVSTAAAAFTAVDEALPYTSQMLCRFLTSGVVNNHLVRGRLFVPGLTLSALSDGVPIGTYIEFFETVSQALIDDSSSILVVWARPVDAEHATPNSPERAGSYHTVIGQNVWNQFASLRSRRD